MAKDSTFGYARTDDGVYIGYRVDGDGPIDIAYQSDWPGNIDLEWQEPYGRAWLGALRSFSRVIAHDPRGIGLSSRNVDLPTLETRVSDLTTVLNTIGVRRPVLVGSLATGAVNILAAATRPRMPKAIVWLEPIPRYAWAEDFPWGLGPEDRESEREFLDLWGTDAYAKAFAQEEADLGNIMPPEVVEYMSMASRGACTPDVARKMADIWYEIDVREILGTVATPTLLLVHEDRKGSVEKAEYVAARMPAAEIRRMPGSSWTLEEAPAWAEQILDFIGLERPAATLHTVLSTVLFTDIVDSTATQASLGDHGWKELVLAHHAVVRDALTRWHGVENDTAGDGFYATFDGPARAIHCAQEVSQRVRDLGIQIRAGVHTGECEVIENKCSGLTVSIGARVASNAGPSEVLVSQTVRDLVAGSGLSFEDAGERELKGVPDRWRLYRVVS